MALPSLRHTNGIPADDLHPVRHPAEDRMKVYLIWQEANTDYGVYESAVVIAKSPELARQMQPGGQLTERRTPMWREWVDPEQVKVRCLGTAVASARPGVVCANFRVMAANR